jgi:hypothetical protein
LNACAFIYTMGQDVKNANGEPGNKKKIHSYISYQSREGIPKWLLDVY